VPEEPADASPDGAAPEAAPRRSVGGWIRRSPWLSGLPREVAVLSTVAFCVALGFGIVAPAIPIFAEEFGVSAFSATAVVSVFAGMRLLGALPAGWLVDRTGERITLATGLTIVAVSSALAGFSTTYPMLLVLRGVGGLGSAMFSVSALALLLRVAAPDQRGRAAAAFQGGFLLGGVVGPAVGGLVLGISIRLPFFVYAATLGAAVVVVITTLSRSHLFEAPARTKDRVADQPSSWTLLREALRDRAYVTALSVNLGNGFTSFGLRSALVPLFVVNSLGLPAAWAGYGALASAAVQAPLLSRAGRTTDTKGRRLAMAIGTGVTGIGFLVLAGTSGLWLYLVAMGVLGAGAAFLGAGPSAVVGDITGGRREGPVVATFQMMADVGAIIGPLIAGAIVTMTGSYSAGFLVGAGILAVTFALAATMPETLHRQGAHHHDTTPVTTDGIDGQTAET
jgi:MFS family permease